MAKVSEKRAEEAEEAKAAVLKAIVERAGHLGTEPNVLALAQAYQMLVQAEYTERMKEVDSNGKSQSGA